MSNEVESLRVFYTCYGVGRGKSQQMILVEDGKDKYGAVTCPHEDGVYQAVSKERMNEFEQALISNQVTTIEVTPEARPSVRSLISLIKERRGKPIQSVSFPQEAVDQILKYARIDTI